MPPFTGLIDGVIPAKQKNLIRSTVQNTVTDPIDMTKMLPSLKDLPPDDQKEMVVEKLKQSCYICNFIDFTDIQCIQNKTIILEDLIEYVKNEQNPLTDQIINEISKMISCNLFRTLPNSDYDPLEDEPILEASWPHMQLVYEFFLTYIERIPTGNIGKSIDNHTIMQIVQLFDSEDPRERDYLKTILHRIYRRFLSLRSIIRKHIAYTFLTYLNETHHFNGINELLELVGSIIDGYTIPIKAEHKVFLSRVLIPMHRGDLSIYCSQLSRCIVLYLKKDATLAETVVHGLLKNWPRMDSHKEMIFLREIEEILDVIDPNEFKKIQIPLFKQLACRIDSPHFQIAECVLQLWTNENVRSLFEENYETLMPIVFPNLYVTSKSHWNQTVVALAYNVLKLLIEIDEELFNELIEQHNVKKSKKSKDREDFWEKLTEHENKIKKRKKS